MNSMQVLILLIGSMAIVSCVVDGSETNLTKVPASEVLVKINRLEPVMYNHVVIEGDLDLSHLSLPSISKPTEKSASKRALELSDNAHIVESQIVITNSEIHGDVKFNNTIFNGIVDFAFTDIDGDANLCAVDFNKGANFKEAKFNRFVNLMTSKFKGDANFEGARFSKYADFSSVMFGKYASFKEAQFSDYADLMDVAFTDNANFESTDFEKSDFRNSNFLKEAKFLFSKFGKKAEFGNTTFGGYTDFRKTDFLEDVNFEEANFEEDATFADAKFSGVTEFWKSSFNSATDFSGSKFIGAATVYFTGSRFNGSVYLNDIELTNINVEWNSIKNQLVCNEPAYILLIKNFKEHGQYDDADNCYYQYQSWMQSRAPLLSLSKLVHIVSWASCGYGVRWYYTIFFAMLAIFLFGLYFYQKGRALGSRLTNMLTFSTAMLLNLPKDWCEVLCGAIRYRNYVENNKYMIILERILGWCLVIILINTLSRIMIRY